MDIKTKSIKLSPRLRQIADAVPFGASLADIGTDHAYIPAYLAQNGLIKHAVASDVIEGPLKHARETVRVTNTGGMVDIRLGDGLKTVGAGEVDTVIIAGMGGILISEILSASPDVLRGVETLILQPMTGVYELRKFLRCKFEITREYIVRECEKLYLIISAAPLSRENAGAFSKEDEPYLYIGKYLFENRPEHFDEYFKKTVSRLEKKSLGLKKARGGAEENIKELDALIEKLYKLYSGAEV